MAKTPAGKTWINVKSAFGLNLNASEVNALNAKRGKDDAEVMASTTFAPGRHLVWNEVADDSYVKAHCEDHDNAGREVDDLAGASLFHIMERAQAVGVEPQPDWTVTQIAQAVIDAETAERTSGKGLKLSAAPDPVPADAGPDAIGDPSRGGSEHPPPPPPPGTVESGNLGVNPIGSDNTQTGATTTEAAPAPAGRGRRT